MVSMLVLSHNSGVCTSLSLPFRLNLSALKEHVKDMLNCQCTKSGSHVCWEFPGGPVVTGVCFPGSDSGKKPPANAGDLRDLESNPGLGRSGGGNGNLLQCSCLENPMDRGAWWTIVHEVPKTGLKQLRTHLCQWSLCASTAGGMGSIPGGGTKILKAVQCGQKFN